MRNADIHRQAILIYQYISDRRADFLDILADLQAGRNYGPMTKIAPDMQYLEFKYLCLYNIGKLAQSELREQGICLLREYLTSYYSDPMLTDEKALQLFVGKAKRIRR